MGYSSWGHEESDMTKETEHVLPFDDVTMSPQWIHTTTINILVSSLQMRELKHHLFVYYVICFSHLFTTSSLSP